MTRSLSRRQWNATTVPVSQRRVQPLVRLLQGAETSTTCYSRDMTCAYPPIPLVTLPPTASGEGGCNHYHERGGGGAISPAAAPTPRELSDVRYMPEYAVPAVCLPLPAAPPPVGGQRYRYPRMDPRRHHLTGQRRHRLTGQRRDAAAAATTFACRVFPCRVVAWAAADTAPCYPRTSVLRAGADGGRSAL